MRAALLLLWLVPLTSHAAPAGTGPDSTHGRWSLGLSLGAGAGYRTLSATTSSTTSDVVIKSRDDREQPALAFGTRAGLSYRLGNHWGVEAGVGYFQLGWRSNIDLSGLTFGDQIDPRRGFIYSTEDAAIPSRLTLNDRFHYLEVPVGITFNLGRGKWRSVSSLGIATAFLVAAKDGSNSTYPDGREEKDVRDITEYFNAFNLFPYLSSGIAFRAWDRWELRLQPTVRYGLLQIIDAPVTGHLYMGSIDLGVRFEL